jgi:hypothetical protein
VLGERLPDEVGKGCVLGTELHHEEDVALEREFREASLDVRSKANKRLDERVVLVEWDPK